MVQYGGKLHVLVLRPSVSQSLFLSEYHDGLKTELPTLLETLAILPLMPADVTLLPDEGYI